MTQTKHGNQCICQICTCGRHRCPYDRNMSQILLGDGRSTIDQYKRKEYATTVSKNYERTRPSAQRAGELKDRPRSSGNGTKQTELSNTFLNRLHKSDYNINNKLAADTKERLITSTALRDRERTSHINNLNLNNSPPLVLSTSYQEQTKHIKQGPYKKAQEIKPAKSELKNILASYNTNSNYSAMKSVNHSEYKEKITERSKTKRPTTSDIWKNSGTMDLLSVSKLEYSPKKVDYVTPVKPKESSFLKTKKTLDSNIFDVKKPGTSELWDSNNTHELISISRRDYSATKGDRYKIKKPQDSNLLKREGTIENKSTSQRDFNEKIGERYDVKRPESMDIWEKTNDEVINRQRRNDYSATKGERFQIQKPKDSNLLKGDGPFESESINKIEYGIKKGERVKAKRPNTSDFWKQTGKIESSSVNRSEYFSTKGKRYDLQRLEDSNLLQKGKFPAETTSNRRDFKPNLRGERYPMKVLGASEIWNNNDFDNNLLTVNQEEYGEKKGDRHTFKKLNNQPANPLNEKNNEKLEYYPKLKDSFQTTRTQEKNEKLQILPPAVPNEKFGPEGTINSSCFTSKISEHQEIKRPETSDIWKKEGRMDQTTVTQDQYTKKKIDQRTQYIPNNTLTLHNNTEDDKFISVSHDAFNAAINLDSKILHQERLNRSNANQKSELSLMFNENYSFPTRSIIHDDFGLKSDVIKLSPIPHLEESQIVDPNASFDGQTVYSSSFRGTPNKILTKAVRPSTALKLSGTLNLTTGYQTDFDKKRLENGNSPCVASKLIESVKKNNSPIENYEFKQTDNGHHYFMHK